MVAGRPALGVAAALRVVAPDLGLVPCADARLVAALGALIAAVSWTSARLAERISRDLRRLTLRACNTPCSDALSRAEVASFSNSAAEPSSTPSMTCLARATAVRTDERTRRLRSCFRAADRMRLRAELVFAMLSRLVVGAPADPGQIDADFGAGPAPQYTNRSTEFQRAAARVRLVLRFGRAPAKLNLALELTGRRADGYHQLAAVSQTVDWSDVVALEGEEPNGRPAPAAPDFRVWGPQAHRVPLGTENIAVRAAVLLREQKLVPAICRLGLEKRIPTQSGLGGGSSDAAAVLRLAGAGLDRHELERIALECGADVPFGLIGGACLLTGVGEEIASLPPLGTGAFLIVVLGSVATAAAYAATNPRDFSDGSRVERLAAALRDGRPLNQELIGSALQPAAFRAVPYLAARWRELTEATPDEAWAMTGSGGAFFSYLPDGRSAALLARRVARACPGVDIRVALPLTAEAA